MADTDIKINDLNNLINGYRNQIANVVYNLINLDSSNSSQAPLGFPLNVTDSKQKIVNTVPSISNSGINSDTNYPVKVDYSIVANNLIAQFINTLAMCSKFAYIHAYIRKNGNRGVTSWEDKGTKGFYLLDNLPSSITFNTDNTNTTWQNYTVNKNRSGNSNDVIVDKVVKGDLTNKIVPQISEIISLQAASNKVEANRQVNQEGIQQSKTLLNAMYTWWNNQKLTYTMYYTRCYNDCHGNCHGSGRGWR